MNEEWNESSQQEIEINLVDLLLALKQKWWAIIAGLLAGVLLAGVYTWGIQKPTYTASSMVYMRGAGNTISSFQDLQIGAALSKDYEIIFTSRPVLEEVIDRLGLDMNYKQLKDRIEVKNQSDTRILVVSMTGTDAQQVSDIVNTLMEVSTDSVKEIDAKEPYLIEEAVADWTPVGPSPKRNLAMGALLGILLSAGIVVMIYLWTDRVRSVDDVERSIGVPVLCMIPESKSMNYSRVQKRRQ